MNPFYTFLLLIAAMAFGAFVSGYRRANKARFEEAVRKAVEANKAEQQAAVKAARTEVQQAPAPAKADAVVQSELVRAQRVLRRTDGAGPSKARGQATPELEWPTIEWN